PLDSPALEALKACAELRSASLDALRSLARQATLRTMSRGATVAAQGTRSDAAILVVRGRIRSVCRAPNGREIAVEVFRTGDLIADLALVALGQQDGTPQPEGLLIRNRPTQQELANQIAACRETVSRTVSELVRQGLLTLRGRSLLVSKRLVEGTA